MEWSRIRENFLYDLKRRPAGGRKRPSSAAENQAAGTRIDTPLACIGLALRAPRLGNLHQDADRPIPLADRNSTRPVRCRGTQKVRAANLFGNSCLKNFLRLIPRHRPFRALRITCSPRWGIALRAPTSQRNGVRAYPIKVRLAASRLPGLGCWVDTERRLGVF
jgi:hypothetical protein